MKFSKLFSISLTIIAPFMIFLSSIHLAGFNISFYKEELSKYNVEKNVPEALGLHQSVIDFIKGKSNYLPDRFNEREKQHLNDVRSLVLLLKTILYFLIFLFVILIIASARLAKTGKNLKLLIGKAMLYGGLLTLAFSALLFLSINFDFTSSFESFHKAFFQQGTYSFDPETEIIVNLYPEDLFMDLGLRIMKFAILASFIFIATGTFLFLRNKKIK